MIVFNDPVNKNIRLESSLLLTAKKKKKKTYSGSRFLNSWLSFRLPFKHFSSSSIETVKILSF